jgi:hypothetical protein
MFKQPQKTNKSTTPLKPLTKAVHTKTALKKTKKTPPLKSKTTLNKPHSRSLSISTTILDPIQPTTESINDPAEASALYVESNPEQLTPTQQAQWVKNKMKPIVLKTLQNLLSQYQLAPPDVNKTPKEAILDALLAHELIVDINDDSIHPYTYKNNKQDLIQDLITKVFIPLDILSEDYTTRFKLGVIPPIPYNGKMKTNTKLVDDLLKLPQSEVENLSQVTTVADMIAILIVASGYQDIDGLIENVIFNEENETQFFIPKGENHQTDFSNNTIKLFHPDSPAEWTNLNEKTKELISRAHKDLESAAGLDVFDGYAQDYQRKDVTQLFMSQYPNGQFPNVETYKSYLLQQCVQTLLNRQYLFSPGQKIHYHTVAGDMASFAEQSQKNEGLKLQQEQTIFEHVQQSMPDRSYPKIAADQQGFLPQPPASFLAHGDALGIATQTLHTNAEYPNRTQFRSILYHPSHTVSGLRELFLQHFRHDVTTYFNFVENNTLHKFKTVLNHDEFTTEELNTMKDMIEMLYAQNQIDSQFKTEFTTHHIQALKATTSAENVNEDSTPKSVVTQPLPTSYQHVLNEKYPVFAQKCLQILVRDCNEHLETVKKQHVASAISTALGGASAVM